MHTRTNPPHLTPNDSMRGPDVEAVSPRVAARLAGVSYLAMFVLAIVANFVVRERLIAPGDAAATATNIGESIGLFRIGLLAFLGIFVLDVAIAWTLHVVFRGVSRDLSLVAAWFRVVYSALLGVGLAALFNVAQLVDGTSFAFLDSGQVQVQTMVALSFFEMVWLVGLVSFGIHLVLLGILVMRSGLVTKVLGYVLAAAGVAYVADTVAHGVMPDYDTVAGVFLVVVAIPSIVGEGWLGLWLVGTHSIRGRFEGSEGRRVVHGGH
ncbi:MAG: DUF4386 domain-containing protein [Acidimicrobiia bacterium]|nr:DUF4386 domain-containing protein [Acidimicrobiia bacterium]